MRLRAIMRTAAAATAAASLVGGVLASVSTTAGAQIITSTTTQWISSASGSDGGRELSAVSANGRYVVFVGRSSATQGVYVADQLTGKTTRLTTGNDMNPAISPDGQYVAFARYGSTRPVYLLNRATGALTLQSVSSSGTAATGGSGSDYPSVSANGRYVAFQSTATNLGGPTGSGGGPNKVYVHDNVTGQTTMVSVTSTGAAINGNALMPDITPDGKYVAFSSDASNLLPTTSTTETTAVNQVYVHNMKTGATTIASVSSTGAVGDAASAGTYGPSISNNGNLVAFESDATNLVADDTNGVTDAFVHDMVTGTTTRVSVNADGSQAIPSPLPDGVTDTTTPVVAGAGPQISGDGTTVAFESDAPLTTDDANGVSDVYTYAMGTGTITRVSAALAGGTEATGTRVDGNTGATVPENNGSDPAIGLTGQFVTFTSDGNLTGTRPASTEGTGWEPAIFMYGTPSPSGTGYWPVASDGGVFAFGGAGYHGSLGGMSLNKPIVAAAATSDGGGYWLAAADGGVFAFGDATFQGSMGGTTLNKPIVGMAASPSGDGYWLVASDGGVFAFGTAGYHGSTGGKTLNQPIVGMAATPDGGGYWLVASDGGVFSFGDAAFRGSTGAITLNQPVVGLATTPDGGGYWLVASDGGVFAFGDATFKGSTGAITLNQPVVGVAASPDGGGYWLVARDGGVFAFGSASFMGSAANVALNAPIVGITSH